MLDSIKYVLKSTLPTPAYRAVGSMWRWIQGDRAFDGRPSRWYIHESGGLERFFVKLNRRGVEYVVLRWFADLPSTTNGDVDMLVADDSVVRIISLLQRNHANCAMDIYSASGAAGGEYTVTLSPGSYSAGIAYYPPHLASRILARRELWSEVVYVPCLEDHFLSLAYHALYQKGHKSALPMLPDVPGTDSKYSLCLSRLRDRLQLAVSIDMDSLDQHLASRGWRPPLDTLQRLAQHNSWVKERFIDNQPSFDQGLSKVVLFLIRQRAMELHVCDEITRLIEAHRFVTIGYKTLSPDDARRCTESIRGGNWGRGPWPMSGGIPACAILAWDPRPSPVSADLAHAHPLLENGRTYAAKEAIRVAVNERLCVHEQLNVLHSSDNAQQAWEYATIAMPEMLEMLKSKVRQLNSQQLDES